MAERRARVNEQPVSGHHGAHERDLDRLAVVAFIATEGEASGLVDGHDLKRRGHVAAGDAAVLARADHRGDLTRSRCP